MPDWSVEQWVAAVSAGVAAISFLFNWIVVDRQIAMQRLALRAQMEGEAVQWGFRAIEALSEAGRLATCKDVTVSASDFPERQAALLAQLSALIDQGRIFFPNREADRGADKPQAYQGARRTVLDALVLAYCELDRLTPITPGPVREAAELLNECRRLFVSELYLAIDPRSRLKMLDHLTGRRRRRAKENIDEIRRLVADYERRPGARTFW